MNPKAQAALRDEVTLATVGWFEARGLRVILPATFGQMLTEQGLWEQYEDGLGHGARASGTL